jgi:hypothetical protein
MENDFENSKLEPSWMVIGVTCNIANTRKGEEDIKTSFLAQTTSLLAQFIQFAMAIF